MDKIPRFRRPCPTEAELRSLADRPTLHRAEALALIQGLLPTRLFCSYLDDYKREAKLLLRAFDEGELENPVRPERLVRWCGENNVSLPEPFVSQVIDRIFPLRRPAILNSFTDERIWVLDVRGRRRENTGTAVRGLDAEICSQARLIILDLVKRYGDWPTKHLVTNRLVKITGHTKEEIGRSYGIKSCITVSEFDKAKRNYRRSRYVSLDEC
jgi:hypothetical protein